MSEDPGGFGDVQREFQIDISPEVEAGVYADFISLWHTPDAFVLDFAALKGPPQQAQPPAGPAVQVFPTRVVARVRIPPGQVFELMRGLEQQLSTWEAETGRRDAGSPPDEPLPPAYPE